MGIYFLGDPHLGHGKLSEMRGFNSIKAHDDYLMGQMRELGPSDRLWAMGDLSSGKSAEEQVALEFFGTLNCSVELVFGNHDTGSGINRNGYKKRKHFSQYFNSLNDFAHLAFMNEQVMLSHYPYAAAADGPDRMDRVRYEAFRLPDLGHPLIHAHTHHSNPHAPMPPKSITRIESEDGLDLNSLCVSWEARRGLTAEGDVAKWLKARAEARDAAKTAKIKDFFGAIHGASQA